MSPFVRRGDNMMAKSNKNTNNDLQNTIQTTMDQHHPQPKVNFGVPE